MTSLGDLAARGDLRGVRERLDELDVTEIVEIVAAELGRRGGGAAASLFRSLPKDLAIAVFEALEPPLQGDLVGRLRDETEIKVLLEGLDPDDRAELLEELPAKVTKRLLSGLSPGERSMTAALLGFPAGSVGRRMSPEVATVPETVTVGEALERVRREGDRAETIYLVPVVGEGRRLVGVVSLRRLLVTGRDVPVRDVCAEPVSVLPEDGEETAARTVRENGLIALPVVDHERRLLGVFTVDDAMRALERAESEDSARGGGTEPLRRPYLSAGVLRVVRSRIGWLLGLVVGATLTVTVLDSFEDALEQVVALALFVPLLIGTAGNAGAQAATTVVRAITTDDLRLRDLGRVVGRELATGFLLGAGLAVVGFGPAWWFVGLDIAVVLALTVVAICMLATGTGAAVPLVARAAGVDPAVVSAPFITTFVDATGLIIYFTTATLLLGL
ncbi:magnesium transporter [Actinomycetospora cinnamomea]|uniref:Magnesium transporter MgtE n=1 Tax=Actinomycetospora cinnamomea TaxID=663609 RepID=A0A2U1F8N2_9PSEU|nr:magnesium transporter [Actinomycetospora cinnamomea]PVZ08553.1 Mg2+ transporter MgtE [Actinomycetospora cinnamomea]